MELDGVFIVSSLVMEDEESEIRQRKCVNVAMVPPFDFGFPVAPYKNPVQLT